MNPNSRLNARPRSWRRLPFDVVGQIQQDEMTMKPRALIHCFLAAMAAPGATAGAMDFDLITPVMTGDQPGPGKRVRQTAPEYKDTDVYHALYLPIDWKSGGRYPVIVEYTGNKWPASGSTGEVKDANLGYGLSGGRGAIWVCMPYVDKTRRMNAVTWWGDRQATIEYCKVNLPRICARFGGDSSNLFICGFSRGAIATSYIGLADDEIASFWKGVLTHDHFDGQFENWGYPESDRVSALKRLARLKGRPVLACGTGTDFLIGQRNLARFTFLKVPVAELFDLPEGKVIHPHTDLWMHKESKYREQARDWFTNVLKSEGQRAVTGQPATHAESKSQGGDKPQPQSEGRSR